MFKFNIKDKINYFESQDKAYINPPKRIPFFLRFPIWIASKKRFTACKDFSLESKNSY